MTVLGSLLILYLAFSVQNSHLCPQTQGSDSNDGNFHSSRSKGFCQGNRIQVCRLPSIKEEYRSVAETKLCAYRAHFMCFLSSQPNYIPQPSLQLVGQYGWVLASGMHDTGGPTPKTPQTIFHSFIYHLPPGWQCKPGGHVAQASFGRKALEMAEPQSRRSLAPKGRQRADLPH